MTVRLNKRDKSTLKVENKGMDLVSIITPCYRAERTLARTVASALAQTYAPWEMLLISDDGADYEAILANEGLRDERLRFLSTGASATGECHARNTGLNMARGELIAILDADDLFMPEKLELCVPQAKTHGLVTCALEIVGPAGEHRRFTGDKGKSGILPAHRHKQVNITSDSILVYDRVQMDPRYDETLDRCPDLEFVWRCYEHTNHAWHVVQPLHRYSKQPGSLSLANGTHAKFLAAKQELLQRLAAGRYNFKDPLMRAAMQRFLSIAIEAEKDFEAALKGNAEALFEDIIEPLLAKP